MQSIYNVHGHILNINLKFSNKTDKNQPISAVQKVPHSLIFTLTLLWVLLLLCNYSSRKSRKRTRTSNPASKPNTCTYSRPLCATSWLMTHFLRLAAHMLPWLTGRKCVFCDKGFAKYLYYHPFIGICDVDTNTPIERHIDNLIIADVFT